jgi:hypothetical protein
MSATNIDSYHRRTVVPETKVRFSCLMLAQAAANSASSIRKTKCYRPKVTTGAGVVPESSSRLLIFTGYGTDLTRSSDRLRTVPNRAIEMGGGFGMTAAKSVFLIDADNTLVGLANQQLIQSSHGSNKIK